MLFQREEKKLGICRVDVYLYTINNRQVNLYVLYSLAGNNTVIKVYAEK